MKNAVKFLSLVIIMVLFSCSTEPIIESERSLQSVASKAATNKSTVAVEDNLANIVGTSTIHRNENGITVNFKTDVIIPGNAYTIWFVVFDGPGPPTSSNYAAGHIAGESGKGNFSGHLLAKPGFMPLTAEVHVVLRTHGPAQPGMIPDQIHTIATGCVTGFPSGPSLHADSEVAGYCANIQVGVHPPVD
ncbi:hypothetical protein [uncultured Eudoraea sp.]|jgi:hypothetical protein|uniref:hypothetical protein n=1 Tax=uncultured Eudoraea sp. TaxID=1035614 RepID=UPI002632E3C9|nr:hypothetical protein [uncultured Eudoraea sp.]